MFSARLMYILCFLMLLLLWSCDDSSDNAPPTSDATTITGSEALNLAKKSGCFACHSVEKNIVGPAWRAVSERYMGDVDACSNLVEKIKKGGKGNWTDVTGGAPMPPYSPRVSDENINTLVSYILGITGDGCGGVKFVELPLNANPATFEFKQGDESNLYFRTGILSSNSLYKIEIIMINGVIDLSIVYPDSQGISIVVNEFNGIDGLTSYEFIPTERAYDLVITAKTDAMFTLAVTTNDTSTETTFLSLAKVSGCLACHSVLTKIIGPAWLDVSNRYRGDAIAEAKLIEKVKLGGKGNWTEVTAGAPMPPYSPRVSDENITILVQEILKLE